MPQPVRVEDPQDGLVEKGGPRRLDNAVVDIDMGYLAGDMPQVIIFYAGHCIQAVVWLGTVMSGIIAVDRIAIFLSCKGTSPSSPGPGHT